jgi:hypothetical protein
MMYVYSLPEMLGAGTSPPAPTLVHIIAYVYETIGGMPAGVNVQILSLSTNQPTALVSPVPAGTIQVCIIQGGPNQQPMIITYAILDQNNNVITDQNNSPLTSQ